MLSGPIVPAKNGTPKQLIVFLHGYGADGNDLINLAPYFGAVMPDAMFISPHAPQACEMGGMGRQWFSLGGWVPGIAWPEHIWDAVTTQGKVLSTWLDDQLIKYNLTPADLALIGFSQGTMMALHTALRRAAPIAGVVGFSGRLPDPIVPFDEMAMAETALKQNNVPVQTMARPGLPHSIDEQGIMAAIQFLARQFNVA
jgi:phospholipase/carboxylesterase